LAFHVSNSKGANPNEDSAGRVSHLRRRGELRRLTYERDSFDRLSELAANDAEYRSRDCDASSLEASNVFRAVRMLRRRPFTVRLGRGLLPILKGWDAIGGFHGAEDEGSPSLKDSIDCNINEIWGSLVNFCRRTRYQETPRLFFRLGLLSFN